MVTNKQANTNINRFIFDTVPDIAKRREVLDDVTVDVDGDKVNDNSSAKIVDATTFYRVGGGVIIA